LRLTGPNSGWQPLLEPTASYITDFVSWKKRQVTVYFIFFFCCSGGFMSYFSRSYEIMLSPFLPIQNLIQCLRHASLFFHEFWDVHYKDFLGLGGD